MMPQRKYLFGYVSEDPKKTKIKMGTRFILLTFQNIAHVLGQKKMLVTFGVGLHVVLHLSYLYQYIKLRYF